ncbi:divergent polysaccharide deacetylase family protein [Enterobacteriaceae bacterium BIT-l23]|uniref:divergent polysaccharide deacetylase family protein n=1 Tax=Jejubacter sp. L23 TaxID=3092086 RepID=UPI001585064A|nr:divergent polysaccharide deacetylase family protein [Enterobacteriaceae bacterium BIT-l23]
MSQFRRVMLALTAALSLAAPVHAGKLAIVIDDFGYRPHQENQVIALPAQVSVAVLPNAPHAREMALKAHQAGHEVLIHLPMAPISKQPLEKDTLRPDMSSAEIERIIRSAVQKVPGAVGMNNHMGSAMTSSLFGMQKVMQTLENYNLLYFLDSVTIGSTQATRAAAGTGIKVVRRNIFLDDKQDEAEVRHQFDRAIAFARRHGHAIAIGHPHPVTVRVLQQQLYRLPPDIQLVRPSDLLNEPQLGTAAPGTAPPPATTPRNPFRGGAKLCSSKQPLQPVPVTRFFEVLSDSFSQSSLVSYFQNQWRGWGRALNNAPRQSESQTLPKRS